MIAEKILFDVKKRLRASFIEQEVFYMKNNIKAFLFLIAFSVCLSWAEVVWAAIALQIDGVAMVWDRNDEEIRPDEGFYLGTQPEMRRGMVYAPVRFVAEVLGAEVHYTAPSVEIDCDGRQVRLAKDSRTAYIDGEAVSLAGAPYEKEGRTYVPLRFLAEALGCKIDYEEGRVNIRTKPWELAGREVCGVQLETYMTMGGNLFQLDSPYFAKRIYEAPWQGKGERVAAPDEEHLGRWPALFVPDFYYIGVNYYLLDADGDIVTQFDLWVHDGDTYPVSEGYDEYLLCCDGEWFNFSKASMAAFGQFDYGIRWIWGETIDDCRENWELHRQRGEQD